MQRERQVLFTRPPHLTKRVSGPGGWTLTTVVASLGQPGRSPRPIRTMRRSRLGPQDSSATVRTGCITLKEPVHQSFTSKTTQTPAVAPPSSNRIIPARSTSNTLTRTRPTEDTPVTLLKDKFDLLIIPTSPLRGTACWNARASLSPSFPKRSGPGTRYLEEWRGELKLTCRKNPRIVPRKNSKVICNALSPT